MHVVTKVQHMVILAEYKLLDCDKVQQRLAEIKPLRYPPLVTGPYDRIILWLLL